MSGHDDFTATLLSAAGACPPGLRAWNGSDPAQRFAVYRNNVTVSLIDALADTYPVTQAMLGEDFFRAMARLYVRAEPPRSPVLAWYGDSFPDFVQGFPPASGLPYLADLARLEMRYVQAYHAADASALPMADLAGLLADANALAHVRFSLHPALETVRSRYAVVSLWIAHQGQTPANSLGEINLQRGEAALLMRQGLEVEIVRLEAGAAQFIDCLRSGATFADAVHSAAPFDLSNALQLLIRGGAITHFTFQE